MTSLPEPLPEQAHPQAAASPQEVHRLIALYLRTLNTPQTIKTYNTELVLFAEFIENEIGKGLGALTAEDVSLYREHLIKTYAPATAAKKLAVLRRFLIFTFMAGVTTVNPESLRFFAKSPRVRQDSSYNVLTDEELSRMLAAARGSNYRDYVMLAVMAGCGLREVEVVGIRIGDFRDVGGGQTFLRVLGKGEKVRNVPLSPDLWRLIQRYVLLTERSFTSHLDSRKPLFTSRVGKDKPLTTRSVQNIVKKYVRAAGITKAISPHSIRHTVGTNMAVNEAPLLVIQQFLGHS
ncbi:MAG: tyrosine-type recombinase/integrase, partial [Actinomycetota bacterium]|nr:tyrosine-type recombinase/integrase [Actinomycetota bacterium]